MKVFDVPSYLRSPAVHYPWHSTGLNSEGYFYEWAQKHAHEIKTLSTYLPVFWWCNSYRQHRERLGPRSGFGPVEAAQKFVNSLPNDRYFTVSNCDDGPYETMWPNTVVFGCGGYGADIPLPLLTDPHPYKMQEKDLLASFIGNIECGGPVHPDPSSINESSWDVNGRGATTRRRMATAFDSTPNTVVEQSDKQGLPRFRELMARSKFALCPRGYGKTSYRLYESMDYSTVPVYIYDELWLPYLDKLDWSKFCVLCHVNELGTLPTRLQAITESERSAMLYRAEEIHASFFTMEGMCEQIASYVRCL